MTVLKDVRWDKDRIFFTSDTHFNHANIIRYCNRPFNTVEEMNQTLIDNWNSVVNEGDTVFHLGDVALTSKKDSLNKILSKLNGTIYLMRGNHEKDALSPETIDRWEGIYDLLEIFIKDEEVSYENQHIVMCHYPLYPGCWNAAHRGSWHLYGHVHGQLQGKILSPAQMEVGVDVNKFTPVSYSQVKDYVTKTSLGTK